MTDFIMLVTCIFGPCHSKPVGGKCRRLLNPHFNTDEYLKYVTCINCLQSGLCTRHFPHQCAYNIMILYQMIFAVHCIND